MKMRHNKITPVRAQLIQRLFELGQPVFPYERDEDIERRIGFIAAKRGPQFDLENDTPTIPLIRRRKPSPVRGALFLLAFAVISWGIIGGLVWLAMRALEWMQ